jgi:transposase
MDTSKSLFVLHGVDREERPVLRKKLRRRQVLEFFARLAPVRIGIEACGASHHWARELGALGHEVVLIPPQYVKPYVQRGKNDAADAEAICEAMSRPRTKLVPVKTIDQQAGLMLVGVRDQLIGRRTQLSNAIRGHAAEFGLVSAKGLARIAPLLARVAEDETVPALAKQMFAVLGEDYAAIEHRIAEIEEQLLTWHRGNETSQRLARIPGVGPVGAMLLVLKLPDPSAFKSGRNFSAWLGLTAKDHSTGGKQRLGGITRAGDKKLRSVLVTGAMAVVQQLQRKRRQPSGWLGELVKRKPPKLAAVALANKTARIAWKLMVSGEAYDRNHAVGTAAPALAA